MAQTGFTPIALYYSSTAAAAPTAGNLVNGELALNNNDGKLFYKDSAGAVQTIATKGGVNGTSNKQILYNNSGAVGGSNNLVFDGTNVGIGTATPTFPLDVNAASGPAIVARGAGGYTTSPTGLSLGQYNSTTFYIQRPASSSLQFWNSATNAEMTIDSSGNVGIGTASPAAKLDVSNGAIRLSTAYQVQWFNGATQLGSILTDSGPNMTFQTGSSNTERMRIDSSGNLLVGTTNTNPVGANITGVTIAPAGFLNVQRSVGTAGAMAIGCDTVGGLINFYYTTSGITNVGNISITSSTTAYNTSSDYRLKENIAPMAGALGVVQQLKPVTYNWKADGSSGQGFIAHELQAVVPDCVTGKKDGMRIEKYEISPASPAEIDEDGKVIKEAVEAVMGEREVPAYQGIDTSFLVATLTAAIQEQQVMIEELKTKVAALEAK